MKSTLASVCVRYGPTEAYLINLLIDDPETLWNAPIGLQLVGRCQEEEAVIAMTEIVDAALKADRAKARL